MATIHSEVQSYLQRNGRMTTGQMADALGYSTKEVRQACKKLMADGKIDGSKSKRIPAYIINGDYIVVTESRQQLLELVKQYAPSEYSRAEKMPTERLQKFLRNHIADQVVGGPEIWEFWD